MKELPFKMRQESPMEKYRAKTWDTKEPETLEWIKSFNPIRQDEFIDVGANVGIYSLFAASLFPQLEIIAFEPAPCNYWSLIENRNMNDFDNMRCHAFAVGNYNGLVKLSIPDTTPGSTGAQIGVDANSREVFCIKLDEIIAFPCNVKIDIDGQELEVIKGMEKMLPQVKSILVEVSSKSRQPIIDILLGAGFTMDNRFNSMRPHSRERREAEGINAENIIFTR